MCDQWQGPVRPSLCGLPVSVLGQIRTYVEPPYPPCITALVFPLLCTTMRDRFRSTPCSFRVLCGRNLCTTHMPSVPILQYINDRVRNVGFSHFPTLRLANFARKFLVADVISCGGRGFTAYRWTGRDFTTEIKWRGVKRKRISSSGVRKRHCPALEKRPLDTSA